MVRWLTLAALLLASGIARAQAAPATPASPATAASAAAPAAPASPATPAGPAIDDARLGAAAAQVHALVDQATRAGLPADLLVDKVNEGLAKGVPAPRIVAVVRGLGQALARARTEAQPFAGASPPRGLLKAMVEAHAVGVGGAELTTVLRAGGRERAVQVLTDLVQRGYPAAAAARTVAAVNGRKNALDQLLGQAERLRLVDGATPAEALDALGRASAQGLGLDRAGEVLHHGVVDPADDSGRGPNRETSGVRGPGSGGVAPGRGHGKP